jgi:glycerol kinase
VAFFKDLDDLRSQWSAGHTWKPNMEKQKREELFRLWKKAVTRSMDWVD